MNRQFENFRASELHCPRCKGLRPVRERPLLVLPGAEMIDLRCTACGESLGTREVKAATQGQLVIPRAGARKPARARLGSGSAPKP